MAPVAKSTTAPGQNNKTSATNAPPLMALAGSPGAGFVLWHSETAPPKIVAQLDNVAAIATNAIKRVILFFILTI